MARRIFRNVLLTAILAVLLTAMLIVPATYEVYEERIAGELQLEAGYIVQAMEMAEDDAAYFAALSPEHRVTLIAADGTVLFDSEAESDRMENHAQRPEVIQALAEGSGEIVRQSDTLSEVTIYYAQRTPDGDVLRIASTRSSVLGMFMSVMPLLAGMLLAVAVLSFLIARRAAQRIVAPINALDLEKPLDNETYDELAPLLTRMEQQHAQLRSQMQALENARAELAAIMENMREGMILLDTKGVVLSMNESAAQIFGVDAEARIGRNLLSINRSADLHDLVLSAQAGEACDQVMKGKERAWQVYASPVMKDEAVRGVVLLILDVTERFAAEASRREFTANVSHELKTPLTSISGFAEIIRDGIAKPEDVPGFAGRICDEARRLLALVNDILELSRLDERQGLGMKEKTAFAPMLQSLAEDFAPIAAEKEISLSVSSDDAQVDGYPVLLREMFFNLIDNAVKYTPEGGVVRVEAVKEADCIRCSVSDNGVGIPKEHQAHVFERFYRVDKSHSRATGGTGLGLAIVKHAAEIHHAELELDSEEGRGTVITLRFRQ